MGTRVSYSVEGKMKTIEMRLARIPMKGLLATLTIRSAEWELK